MLRTLRIATLSAAALAAACKTDKPPEANVRPAPASAPAPAARPADPARTAAASPSKPAEAAPVLDPELETKGLAMMDKLADVFVADAADCEKLAVDLKSFAAQNKALLSQLAAAESQETDDQRAGFSKRNAAAQAAVAKKMQSAMTACAAHPSVLAALQEFPGE
jgi:hypothetical protein